MTSRAYCAVDGCVNQKTMKDISFFKLPMDEKRRHDWLHIIGRADLQKKADLKPACHFVCSIHFDESMMVSKPILRPNAVPTRYIPTVPIPDELPKIITTAISKATQTKSSLLRQMISPKNCQTDSRQKENPEGIKTVISISTKKKLRIRLKKSEKKLRTLEGEVKRLKKEIEDVKNGTVPIAVKEEKVET